MTDLSPEARALIDGTRDSDDPSAEQRARVRDKLASALGATVAVTAAVESSSAALAAAAAPATGAAAVGGKLALALSAVAVVAAAGVWNAQRAEEGAGAADATTRPPRTVARESAEPKLAQAAPVPQLAPAAPFAPASATPTLVPAPERSAAPRAVRPRAASSARASGSSAAVEGVSVEAPAAAQPSAQVDAPAAPVEPSAPSIERELALIGPAQHALRAGDAAAALELVRRHAQEFPRGALTQERLAAQAIALCRLGRVEAGRGVVVELEHDAPSSPLLPRARRACARGGQP